MNILVRSQKFLKGKRTGWLWVILNSVIFGTFLGVAVWNAFFPITSLWNLSRFCGFVIVGLLIGFFSSPILGAALVHPVYALLKHINENLYLRGDCVRIVFGPHQGRDAQVTWSIIGLIFQVESLEEGKRLRRLCSPSHVRRLIPEEMQLANVTPDGLHEIGK